MVRCECGARRDLVAASKRPEAALGYCTGQRPWLGRASQEKCGGADGKAYANWLLVRSASNSYFPQLLSVISIPDPDEQLRKAVDLVWNDLEVVDTPDELKYERKKAKVKAALEGPQRCGRVGGNQATAVRSNQTAEADQAGRD